MLVFLLVLVLFYLSLLIATKLICSYICVTAADRLLTCHVLWINTLCRFNGKYLWNYTKSVPPMLAENRNRKCMRPLATWHIWCTPHHEARTDSGMCTGTGVPRQGTTRRWNRRRPTRTTRAGPVNRHGIHECWFRATLFLRIDWTGPSHPGVRTFRRHIQLHKDRIPRHRYPRRVDVVECSLYAVVCVGESPYTLTTPPSATVTLRCSCHQTTEHR